MLIWKGVVYKPAISSEILLIFQSIQTYETQTLLLPTHETLSKEWVAN